MSGAERAVASLSREKAGCEEWAALSEDWLEEDTEQFLRTKIESMEVVFTDRCEEKSNLQEVGFAQRAKRMRRNTKTGLISSQTSCREGQKDPSRRRRSWIRRRLVVTNGARGHGAGVLDARVSASMITNRSAD